MTTAEQSASLKNSGQRLRVLELLPWFLCALAVASVVTGAALVAADALYEDALFGLACIGPAVVGALVASRVRSNPIGWLLLVVALLYTVETLAEGYMDQHPTEAEDAAVRWASWLAEWVWIIPLATAGVFIPLLFPNGRLLSPRWRYILWLQIAAMVLAVLAELFNPGPMDTESGAINPTGIEGLGWLLDPLAVVTAMISALGFCAAGASQVIRFRRSEGEEREQLKWIAFVAAIGVLGLAFAFASLAMGESDWGYVIGATGWMTGLIALVFGLPVAIGIAILRYRLYDIDWIINRTLVYVPLTAILAGLYVASTGLFRAISTELTESGSDASVAVSTLAVVALLTPLKNKLQALVDKHFKENRDPAKELDKLTQQTLTSVEVLDHARLIQRFLASSMQIVGARGACVYLDDGVRSLSISHGDCDAPAALTLPLSYEEHRFGTVEVGPRQSSRPYTPAEQQSLQRAADVVAYLLSLRGVGVRD
jgi:hypothetical protein